MDYIISYDIADEKRVAKVGRYMAKRAFRIQKSVFIYYEATKEEIEELLKGLLKICDEKKDDIRVYKIKDYGVHLADAVNLKDPFII